MKSILRGNLSHRHGIDGWAVRVDDSPQPLWWTFSTTRQEARECHKAMNQDMFKRTAVVKVRIKFECV